MGTQEGGRDWVAVANDLLTKCNINLQAQKLTDCNSNVFISLYESILGEKVPDFIAIPRSQEDDAHNVQSVIDSLSLDYLQISLSHITGENIVRGDHESIKNLLEIFDGLLEYLNEEIQEDLQNGVVLCEDVNERVPDGSKELGTCDVRVQQDSGQEGACSSSNGVSSDHGPSEAPEVGVPACTGAEVESVGHHPNAESLEGPREGAAVVSALPCVSAEEAGGSPASPKTSEAPTPSGQPSDQDTSAPMHTAIALQPALQSDAPHRAPAGQNQEQPAEQDATVASETDRTRPGRNVNNGLSSPQVSQSPAHSDGSDRQRSRADVEGETLEPTRGGPHRVLFRTQPDVLFLKLQEEIATTTPSPPDTDEDQEEESSRRPSQRAARRFNEEEEDKGFPESLSHRREKNKKAEKELHLIAEKLSHRIEVLDQMLKRVLDESGESSEVKGDEESCRSNGILESHKSPRQHSEFPHAERDRRDHTEADARSPEGRRLRNATPDRSSGEARHPMSARKHRRTLLNQLYEEELKRYEQEELDRVRLRAQEAEREYREAILRDASRNTRSSPARMKAQHKSERLSRTRQEPLQPVTEKQLLPLLLDELPHLHISPQALGEMWQKQLQHVERLSAASSPHSRRRSKLTSELEEAQRKHQLLQALVQKQQAHRSHLRDFKEQNQQQRALHGRLRDQRQQVARAKKYHQEFHVQHRARLMKARTREERMFRQLFEEGLELQKMRLREQRALAKEQQLEEQRRQMEKLTSMENYYKDQFSLLAEKVEQERQENHIRKRAQEKALIKMKRDLRARMEREIRDLQKIILQNDEDEHFKAQDLQRLRGRIQLASFQNQTSYLH
ncbi:centrosomal protein of 95 kDa-like [Synchiropus splendidus]|uniref:centrosomal protein of 95 kDa-like n=1 Tax=Synchiropus splendidus TaxID=270530 RepID=UPI00237E78F2|nr:centrosomal protein of 95 kDa-like [Synchiropus splendidus]